MSAEETPTEFSSMSLSAPVTILTSRTLDIVVNKYSLNRSDVLTCLDVLNSGKDIVFMRVSEKVITDNDPGYTNVLIIGGLRYFAFVREPARSL